MASCCALLLAALVSATVALKEQSVTLGDKWVHFVKNDKQMWTESQRWTLTADPRSTAIKVFCPDFRMPIVEDDPCKFSQVYFDDGVAPQKICGSRTEFTIVGNSPRLIVNFNISERIGGFLDCLAKSVHPPRSEEIVELKLGEGVTKIEFPEVRGQDLDKTWRFKSMSTYKISLQCELGMERRFASSKVCARDLLTVDDGTGPKQFCGYEKVVAISKDKDITMRAELYPGTEGHIDCVAQVITGPNPNEHNNVKIPDEDSSEFGVAPGRKRTSCPCGMANKNSARIINGTETTEGKYPFMASIRGATGRGHFCGGSILTPIHILTAAHCVSDRWTKSQPVPQDLMPAVGVHSTEDDASHGQSQKVKVRQVFIPDEWFAVKGSLAGDIALLVLETPIKFGKYVSPVCLTPTQPPIINRFIKAMGWGLTEEGYPDKMREANVQVLDKALCNNNHKETCFKTGPSTTCFGDSGGPYVYVDPETNRYTQVALVSYGLGECVGRFFIGTNVVHWYDWIQQHIRGA
ncbi:serine-type endopeptidase activity [Nesidiocoris tenuis]|uniref:Serine-type endopeptidase activity n=2 Tax=Nesidiocoris tenuis TaxID=355587 RepID=A0ABN7BCM7_9HEMI|nr:serine-type endopeptidase activity [Nesidiocoris tenuis]